MSKTWYGFFLALVVMSTFGARAGGGVYGGYVGSDSSMNTDIENMGRRALSEDALRSHNGGRGQSPNGRDVTLHIMFPSQQTGLSNIEMVMLVPEGPGAHDCQALAQEKSQTELYSLFIPKKDVRAGMLYDVVVSDAMGDQFAVGRIRVSGAAAQDFTVDAPELTPGSPHYQGPGSAAGFAVASPGGGAAASNGPRGAVRGPVAPGSEAWVRANEEFRREAALQPWVMGMKVLTITPYMLAVIGHPNSHLRGVIVDAVIAGGPAERAGVRKGDLIAAVDGRRCVNAEQFVQYARAERGMLDLVMFSQLHHAIVRMRVVGYGRRRPQPGYDARDRWRDPRAVEGWQRRRGYGGEPQAGNGYVPPASSGYEPPRVGPGYVPPSVGPGFVPPGQATVQQGSAAWQQQQTRANPLPPGSSGFRPPVTGPGYVPPAQTAASQQAGTQSNQKRTHPSAQGSSGFTPPTTGAGFLPPGH
ncbi:MAG: PDZ domain-containing protein [Alphaproteobacteria bacterium]|nr:PDZ domain-containing protein [Alphaproteobacteria bacterium]